MAEFTEAFGIPESENLGGGLGSSAYGGGHIVSAPAVAQFVSSSQPCYIQGTEDSDITSSKPAYIEGGAIPITSSKELYLHGAGNPVASSHSAFIYGGSTLACNDFSTDPNVQVTNPAPTHQVQAWNSGQQRLDWELQREPTSPDGSHYFNTTTVNSSSPRMKMDWHITYSDFQRFASNGGFRYGDVASSTTRTNAGKFIALFYSWDYDDVGTSSRGVRGLFYNGTTAYVTSWVNVGVGTTYAIEVYIDPDTNLGVLKVGGTTVTVDIVDHTTFSATYSRFSIPSAGGTSSGSKNVSYALGYIDNLCLGAGTGNPSVFTSTSAFIEAAPFEISGKDAWISGPHPLASSKTAFIHGHVPATSSRASYIHIIHGTTTQNKNAFLYGISREHFSHPAFIQIETPTLSAKPSYVHIETPVTVSKGVTIVASERVDGSKEAYFHGWDIKTSIKPAFVQIETPMSTSKGAFLNGPPIESSKAGFIAAPWTQAAFIQIETPRSTNKSAYIRGLETRDSAKRSYTFGHLNTSSLKRAFIQVITPRLETKNAYISGPSIGLSAKPMYMEGLTQKAGSKNAYMYGHFITPPSAIGAHIRIEEFVRQGKPAFIKVGDPLVASKPSYVRGFTSITPVAKGCFIDSREKVNVVKPAYVHIQTPQTSLKRAFVQIHTPITATLKRAHIRSVGSLVQPELAFINGAYKMSSNKGCYIHSETPLNAPVKRCYIPNITFADGTLRCYIFETGLGQAAKIAYLNGTRVGEVDVTKKCYINGTRVHNYVVFSTTAYINGGTKPSLPSSKNCFIQNRDMIGLWKLDDGEFDSGTAVAKDSSTIGNNASIINWPEWAGGPYRKDDC